MHAASKAETGSVYVLEMGEQINVAEMARNLIRLSGFVPDEEISLEFTGLRPGEKLFEELVGIDEAAEPSGIEGIHRVRANRAIDHEVLRPLVEKAIDAAIAGEDARVLALLKAIIPSYQAPVLDGNEASSRMVVAAP
jgi:O-antigen biosynthesis protein WbqV